MASPLFVTVAEGTGLNLDCLTSCKVFFFSEFFQAVNLKSGNFKASKDENFSVHFFCQKHMLFFESKIKIKIPLFGEHFKCEIDFSGEGRVISPVQGTGETLFLHSEKRFKLAKRNHCIMLCDRILRVT